MLTRQEHVAWCKKRAHEYIERGELMEAMTSMLSDLGKHPKTERSTELGGLMMITINSNSIPDVIRFVDGFN